MFTDTEKAERMQTRRSEDKKKKKTEISTLCGVDLVDKARNHVAVLKVKVVVRPIDIRRNHAGKLTPMLFKVRPEENKNRNAFSDKYANLKTNTMKSFPTIRI
jgi:hypothetical protein